MQLISTGLKGTQYDPASPPCSFFFYLFASSALKDEGRLQFPPHSPLFFKAEIIQRKGALWHSGLTRVSSLHRHWLKPASCLPEWQKTWHLQMVDAGVGLRRPAVYFAVGTMMVLHTVCLSKKQVVRQKHHLERPPCFCLDIKWWGGRMKAKLVI